MNSAATQESYFRRVGRQNRCCGRVEPASWPPIQRQKLVAPCAEVDPDLTSKRTSPFGNANGHQANGADPMLARTHHNAGRGARWAHSRGGPLVAPPRAVPPPLRELMAELPPLLPQHRKSRLDPKTRTRSTAIAASSAAAAKWSRGFTFAPVQASTTSRTTGEGGGRSVLLFLPHGYRMVLVFLLAAVSTLR